ncbi:MAG: hypothetical protein IJU91_09520 [Selenomonadaceae bacterium]|nr:hypothetical protein [Selenomonadaceae bacterium]
MRGVAREIFDLDKKSADGPAIMAEAALYLENLEEAEILARDALTLDKNNLRARFVLGGVAAEKFNLIDELKLLKGVIDDAHKILDDFNSREHGGRFKILYSDDKKNSEDDEKIILLTKTTLYKALCLISNGLYLSGDALSASNALREASGLTKDNEQAAEIYSKHLFLRNYREFSPYKVKQAAQKYDSLFASVTKFSNDGINYAPDKKLKIGYISPDFRQHAVANFILPLLKNYDAKNFAVTCYQTGKRDFVTDKLKKCKVTWRDVSKLPVQKIAQIIHDDRIDILVDLAGHSQNNSLPVLARKPAPIQICAIGYTATTGLKAVDYFLSDHICMPEQGEPPDFTEKILRVSGCHLCYTPGLIRDIPAAGVHAPVLKNGYVTYGSFNNFAKVSDSVLYAWRAILEEMPTARLVIKSKLCSIDSGIEILTERLKKMSFPLDRVELRPYSKDYLEQYRDIDIALDTFPYTGGLTTCEALYMGVPVIAVRGKSHGSRFGSSILTAADLTELIAINPMGYIKKAVQVGQRIEFIAGYHAGLREQLLKSRLMDAESYMRDLEKCYRDIWQRHCQKISEQQRFGRLKLIAEFDSH